jgi:hypothetical protein
VTSTAGAWITLDPEDGLLVAAASGRCRLPIADAGRDLDWERVLGSALWHGMAPMLQAHLSDPDLGLAVPPEVADHLRRAARESTVRSMQLAVELDRVLALLDSEGIPVLLLKGAALLELVYDHPGLRPMVDLDLLVPEQSVRRAHELVQGLGYQVAQARLSPDTDAHLAVAHHHFPLVHRNALVELHHKILWERPDYDVAGVWERSTPSPNQPPRRLPAPEDLVLHVSAHFALDRMRRNESALRQLADLARTADRFDLDWDAVVDRARRSEVAELLFLALDSADVLFGRVAPPEVLDAVRPPSYTPELGELFLRERVLATRPSLPLEQLSRGVFRRVFPGRRALERYIHLGEPTPSLPRLYGRRFTALSKRLVREAPLPGRLARDVRLSRWMVTLRDR